MNLTEIVSVPIIVTMVWGVLFILKKVIHNDKFSNFIPLIAVGLGALLGIAAYFISPQIIAADNVFLAAIIGAVSGWAATGADQTVKQIKEYTEQKDE